MKKTWLSLLLVLALTIFLAVPATANEGAQATVFGIDGEFTLQEAINQASDKNYVTLQDDIAEGEIVTVDKDIYLDLNGHDIAGTINIAPGKEIKLFDSMTKDYNADNEDGYGKITGTVNGTIARTMNTPKDTYGYNYRYLTIKDASGHYHAHRFYISVKSTVLYPTVPALNYRTVLRCDSVVAGYINNGGAYGVRVKAWDTAAGAYTKDGDNDRIAYGIYDDPVAIWDGEDENNRVTQLENIFAEGQELSYMAETIQWHACAYIKVNDSYGEPVEIISATAKKSLKEAIVEADNMDPSTLNATQKDALGNMYKTYEESLMSGWGLTNIPNYSSNYTFACLCGDPTSTDNPCADAGHRHIAWSDWDGTTFPTTAGNYILQNALTLDAAPEVTGFVCIDLNGKTINGPLPVVNDGAVLNLVNHTNTEAVVTATGGMKIEAGGNVSLYDGVAIGGSIGSGFAGMIDNYGDMNVYGGVISGYRAVFLRTADSYLFMNKGVLTSLADGNRPENGGTIYNNGTVEITGDAIVIGGTATALGGNIYLAGGSTLNVSGGTITGGKANYGGNIIVIGGAEVNISGGRIYGGAAKAGGSDYAYNNDYANVQVSNGTVKLSGGEVSGIVLSANGSLTLSGDAVVNTYTDTESSQTSIGLKLVDCVAAIDETDGDFTGSVVVSGVGTSGQLTGTTKQKYVGNFSCGIGDTVGKGAVYQDGCIYILGTKTMCVCGGKADGVGDHTCSDSTMVEYTANTSMTQLPKTGNIFLGSDLVLTTQSHLNSAGALNIDLNGHDLTFAATATDGRVFKLDGNSNGTVSVNLTDSVGGGKVTVTGDYVSSKTSTGSLVWTYVANTTFNQYGGILDASNLTGNAAGVAVYLSAGTYNMYGGQIKGGTVTATGGGAVYINSGAEFNLYGGTVSGGKTSGTVNGGNFYVNGGTLDVSGGEIVGGYASNVGGNVFVANSGTLKVSGDAKIYGGSCQSTPDYGHNCANVQIYNGNAYLSGGTVSGIFVRGSTGILKLSGSPVINTYYDEESKQTSCGLYLGGPATIDKTNGDFNGEIWVSAVGSDNKIVSGTVGDTDYSGCFHSLVANKVAAFNTADGCIYLLDGKIACLCGDPESTGNACADGGHQQIVWQNWTETTFPTATGNYVLQNGLTLSASPTVSGNINIDLNGSALTSANLPVVSDGAVLNLVNHSENAATISTSKGMVVEAGGTASIYDDITVSGSVGGLAGIIDNYGDMYVYGGSVSGWRAVCLRTADSYLYMNAGTLRGSSNSNTILVNGGTVVIEGSAEIIGATISGDGGAISNAGTVTIGGNATVTGGTAANGGSIYNSGTITIQDNATVSGGTATSNGGAISNAGTVTIGGKAKVTGGTATGKGGSIYNTSSVTISGNATVTGGTATSNGGSIYTSGTVTIMDKATVSGGESTGGQGGNIYVEKGTLNVSGGSVTGGHAYSVGGNIIVFGGAEVNISGGQIYGGSINNSGTTTLYSHNCSNVQIYSGTVNLSGGTVSGIFVRGSTGILKLSGSPVINTYYDEESKQTSCGLYLGGPATIDKTNGDFNGEIWVSAVGSDNKIVSGAVGDTDYSGCFHSLVANKVAVFNTADGCIYLLDGKIACLCGDPDSIGNACADGGHKQIIWQNWTATSFPTTTGNYILQNGLSLTAAPEVIGNVNVDLNGSALTGIYLPDVKSGAVLNMVNHSVTQATISTSRGMMIEAGGTASIYDGITISGSIGTGFYGMLDIYGSVYVYGGSITGWRTVYLRETTSSLYVNGGTLTGAAGGAIQNKGTVEIEGNATVNGGTVSEGGAIYNTGSVTIGGDATVNGGSTTNGGAIYNAGTVEIKDNATVTGGTASSNGGAIYNAGTVEIKDNATVSGGTATALGGNIYLAGGSTLNVSGGTITGGKANFGGNIILRDGAALNVSGDAKIYGGAAKNNGSDYAYNNDYANVQVSNGTVKLSGGEVSGIYLAAAGTLTLSDDAVINTHTEGEQTSIGLKQASCVTAIDETDGSFTGSVAVSQEGTIATTTNAELVNNFTSAIGDGQFVHENDSIVLKLGVLRCLCGDPESTGNACADADHKQIFWQNWSETNFPTATGNYILQNELNLTRPEVTGNVNINLNGQTISGQLPVVIDGAVLNLVNHSETPATVSSTYGLTIEAGGSASLYDGIDISGSFGNAAGIIDINGGKMFIYGGTVVSSGRAVCLRNVTTSDLYMNAGTLQGGNNNTILVNGGAVVIEGSAEIIGATISGDGGAISNAGTVTIGGNATVTGGTAANGGGIYTSGTLTIQDNATVSGGTATALGGNIYLAGGSTLNVSGGTITGGKANFGGNIILRDGAALNVSGDAKIYGGAAKNNGSDYAYNNDYANVQVSNGTVKLSGGEVSGIYLAAAGTLTLSDDAVINTHTEGEQTSIGLKQASCVTAIDETDGDFNGEIWVSAVGSDNKIVSGTAGDTDYSGCFRSLVADKSPVYDDTDGCIYLTAGKIMCVCGYQIKEGVGGHTHARVEFEALDGTTTQLSKTGNYYLTDNVTLTTKAHLGNTGALNIDLNGHDLTFAATEADTRVFKIDGSTNGTTVSLTDSVGGGKVTVTGDVTSAMTGDGSLVWTYAAGSTFNQYGGILDASKLTGNAGGVAVTLRAGTYNMYGGEIRGGTVTAIGGGAVYVKGGATFNQYGGDIYGGTATAIGGGAVRIDTNGEYNLKGGTVSGGTATGGNGGNFRVDGTLNVAGGNVTDGYAVNLGGNIYVSGNAKVVISGDEIKNGGSGASQGGNIWAQNGATLEVSDGQIYGGYGGTKEAPDYTHNYANVGVYGATATLSGGTVSGLTFNKGGDDYDTVLTLSGSAKIEAYEDAEGNKLGVGLYLIDRLATVDETFTGSVAVSNKGQITNATTADKAQYFVSLVTDFEPVFDTEDNCIYNRTDFAVGYGAQNITPTASVPLAGSSNSENRYSEATLNDLYMTCVAITDENGETVLMYTMDLLDANYAGTLRTAVREALRAEYDIPFSNILFTATHTHSGPDLYSTADVITTYKETLKTAAINAATAALADRTKVENMSFGTGNTSNLSFVRHYTVSTLGGVATDMVVSDNHLDNKVNFYYKVTGHKTELDSEMRILRFTFAGKDPVLMVNWQCHPHRTGGATSKNIASDIVGAFRDSMGTGYRVAYYQGGAGNVNDTSRIESEKSATPADYVAHGNAMATTAKGILNNMITVPTGEIAVTGETFQATNLEVTDDQYNASLAVIEYYKQLVADGNSDPFTAAEQFGQDGNITGYEGVYIYSYHHALATRNLYVHNKNQEAAGASKLRNIPISTITIGDQFAWCTVAGELFDSTAKSIRDTLVADTSYDYSFVTGYTNGHGGYFPASDAYNYGSYEVDVTKVVKGTAEAVAARLIDMVKGGN